MALNLLKGVAQGIAGKTLRKVAGNLPGLLGFGKDNTSNSDLAPLTQNKFSTKNYSFPLDVEGPPGTGNQGHYIMFFINQQQNAKLSFGDKEKKDHGDFSPSIKSKNKIPEFIKKLQSDGSYSKVNNSGGVASQVIGGYEDAITKKLGIKKVSTGSGSTVSVNRAPTTRMSTAISLFMPPQVSVSYGATYTDTEIGAGAAILGNAATDLMNDMTLKGLQNTAAKVAPQIVGEAKEAGGRLVMQGVGAVGPGMTNLEKVFDMKRGSIKAPRMELAFEGIGKREFSYNFKMMPRSQAEADEIRNIIFAFKSNMLPEFVDGNRAGRRLSVPNTFDIQYMYNGKENDYLHKISTCVLETMDVKYSGEGKYTTFEADDDGAPPMVTELSLNFQEMEIITKERVAEGY